MNSNEEITSGLFTSRPLSAAINWWLATWRKLTRWHSIWWFLHEGEIQWTVTRYTIALCSTVIYFESIKLVYKMSWLSLCCNRQKEYQNQNFGTQTQLPTKQISKICSSWTRNSRPPYYIHYRIWNVKLLPKTTSQQRVLLYTTVFTQWEPNVNQELGTL